MPSLPLDQVTHDRRGGEKTMLDVALLGPARAYLAEQVVGEDCVLAKPVYQSSRVSAEVYVEAPNNTAWSLETNINASILHVIACFCVASQWCAGQKGEKVKGGARRKGKERNDSCPLIVLACVRSSVADEIRTDTFTTKKLEEERSKP